MKHCYSSGLRRFLRCFLRTCVCVCLFRDSILVYPWFFANQVVSVSTPYFCFCRIKHKSRQNQCISEWGGLCSSKTLFMETEIWILYNFHMSWHVILLLSFYNHLKTKGLLLAYGPYKTGNRPHLAHGLYSLFQASLFCTA